jgi:hypothetical protein
MDWMAKESELDFRQEEDIIPSSVVSRLAL